jgi:hypothetical protein
MENKYIMAKYTERRVDSFAVGSIQQSMLDEADFQTEMGSSDWVMCDGRDITGSKLATYIGATLPDARDRFLRSNHTSIAEGAGTTTRGASMRAQQTEDTVLNGITVSGGTASGTFGSASHTHSSAGHSHSSGSIRALIGSDTNSLGYVSTGGSFGTTTTRDYNVTGAVGTTTAATGTATDGTSGSTTPGSTGAASNSSVSSTPASISNNSNVETRPLNITVNTFIKIN